MGIELFYFLLTWTPFLLQGFVWNILVTFLAVILGTAIGAGIASVRYRKLVFGAELCNGLAGLFRNVPSLVFLFLAVFVLPREFTFFGTDQLIYVPLWFKAVLGLSPSVIGFTSESIYLARKSWDSGDHGAAKFCIATWGYSVMITFVASSTASLVGVSELISRSNSLIAATGTSNMIAVYLYAGLYFILGCLVWSLIINKLKNSAFVEGLPGRCAARPPAVV